jgi:hypothetical protein
MSLFDTREGFRLNLIRKKIAHWNRWGPFLSERAWGTVREDYSPDGKAWSYFPHEHARSRAYRWSEDGLGGICDRHQYLCFALSLWNRRDAFLKERAFGLTGEEGNHGEDVKEYYFYLDSTPSHSYMKYLYKYPHAAYPYEHLRTEARLRSKGDPEYELVDTGIFHENRYFDVFAEYAKQDAEDLLIRITVCNRGPEAAPIEILPTLWFRNTWRWGRDDRLPSLTAENLSLPRDRGYSVILSHHWELGDYVLFCKDADELLFTDNETNNELLFGSASPSAFTKDAFHRYVVNDERTAPNPDRKGTKAAARYSRTIPSGGTLLLELRLTVWQTKKPQDAPFSDFDAIFAHRKKEADEFYDQVLPGGLSADERLVARQGYAGMLWSKQYYHYVVTDWLDGDPGQPAPPVERRQGRNQEWTHLFTRDVISMPDKWEFPWFASWDLAFHCVTLAPVDPQFAKDQIILMLREWYMHPNGQIPAYEWDFSGVNPPVLALAAGAIFEIEKTATGEADYAFLERVFQKMLLNFTWWVNRKDALGKNIFQGGFLGMDNIGVFDRDHLPPGYLLGQADSTSWMAAFAKSMLSSALTLATQNPGYEDLASKFWEHYIYIANSMNSETDPQKTLWDVEYGFFYDNLITSDRKLVPIRARTMVGFVPIFGATVVPAVILERYPDFRRRRQWFIEHRPDLVKSVEAMVVPGPNNNLIVGLVRREQLQSMLRYMLDEKEFLSPYGIRSVSKYHRDHPLELNLGGQIFRLDYEPGESQTSLFGGNSNWRGPIWMPVNFLIVLALSEYHKYYGDSFRVECPTGSGRFMNLAEVANEIACRLGNLFLRNRDGHRPVLGDGDLFQTDPQWRDYIPFHEYFHGDTGRGCGASHQTGWTGLISLLFMRLHANIIQRHALET